MYRSPFAFLLRAPDDKTLVSVDDRLFADALNAAHFCMGSTHPNPSVGAVIAKDGNILSVGFTHAPGGMHAEAHALAQLLPARDRTLYVTLEPCSHYGRTPPCTRAIIDAGITRVVYGVQDPNPRVFGAGLLALSSAGISVEQIAHPELMARAEALIAPFTCWLNKKRPFVTVKIATSRDEAIAMRGQRTKITHPSSDMIVHGLRRAHDAILIGADTARIDNPVLTARLGPSQHGTQPLRVVVSSDLNLDLGLALFDTTVAKTLVLTSRIAEPSRVKALTERNVHVITCASDERGIDLHDGLAQLVAMGITSVLVEPGALLLTSLIEQHLVDEVWWFKAQHEISSQGIMISDQLAMIKSTFTLHEEHRRVDELRIFAYQKE